MDLTSWILKILGIIVLTFISDLIIPNGKTTKTIKGVLAFISVMIIASPLANINFENLNLNLSSDKENIISDSELSDTIYEIRYDFFENNLNEFLELNGINESEIIITAQNNDSFLYIENLTIKLDKTVIKEINDNNINLERLKSLISTEYNIGIEKITFYECI